MLEGECYGLAEASKAPVLKVYSAACGSTGNWQDFKRGKDTEGMAPKEIWAPLLLLFLSLEPSSPFPHPITGRMARGGEDSVALSPPCAERNLQNSKFKTAQV